MVRNLIIWTLILSLAACSGGKSPDLQLESRVTLGDLKILIGKPVAHLALTVFPLYLQESVEADEEFLTLDEMLEQKTVEIREVGAATSGEDEAVQEIAQVEYAQGEAATVNAVEIENRSDKPLYILAGQVIVGGKQDRVITKDTIVQPGEQLQVEVCCVEQGRWSPREDGAGGGSMYLFNSAAKPVANMEIKRNVQLKGMAAQQEVWEEVVEIQACMIADSPTGTFNRVVEKTGKEVDEYLSKINKTFEKDQGICGFVACLNGKVATCDLFGGPRLLSKFRESLLRGYALDALNAGDQENKPEVKLDKVKRFIAEMHEAQGNARTLAEFKHGRLDKLESDRVIALRNLGYIDGDSASVFHMNAYSKQD